MSETIVYKRCDSLRLIRAKAAMKTSVLTLFSLVSLTSASNIFEPVAGTKEERLLACSSSPIDPASLHFMKVGQLRSHGGFIHLASKSNISSLPHLVLKACAHILDLKQLTLFKQLEKAASKNTYPLKRKSKLQGHYSRVFELLSSQCISTLDRTVDVLELFFNSFSHKGDESHLAEHKNNVLRAQMRYARTYHEIIGLAQSNSQSSIKLRNKNYSKRFRNKKDLNSTLHQEWLGLRIRASEFEMNNEWNETSNLTWNDEPWPKDDPRLSSEWWFMKFMRGEWPTFPLLPSLKYLPKKKDGSVNFPLWTKLRDEVSEKVIAFERANRKEKRRMRRQASKSSQNGGFRFGWLSRGKRQVVVAVIAVVALISWLYNATSMDGISSRANSNVDATVRLMDEQNHKLAVQEHSISMLNKSMTLVRNEIELTKLQLSADEVIEEVTVALDVFYNDVNRVLTGLESLSQGRLSPSLLKVRDTMKHLNDIQTKIKPHGLELGISRFEDLYKQMASTIVYSNGSMYNVIHLDTFKTSETFDVFSFIPTPFSHARESAFTIGTGDQLLAINRDESLFFTMTYEEFEDCRPLSSEVKICPSQNVISRDLKTSCLSSLFRGDFESAKRLCMYNKPLERELVTQLSGNEFVLHSTKENTMVKYVCRDGDAETSKTEFVSGSVKLVIQPLCSVITPSNIIDGQLAFAADLPGFEVRPLNLSQLLSTDGIMFDVTNLQKLTEFGEDVGKDVSVESVASQFKHFDGHGMLSGVVHWFSNCWAKFKEYIMMAIIALFAIIFIYLCGPCCMSQISSRCCKSISDAKRPRSPPGDRRKLSFAVTPPKSPLLRLSRTRRSILKPFRRPSTISARSALAEAAAEAEANPATARKFLNDLKVSNPTFNERHVLQLASMVNAAARCKCDPDSCICDQESPNTLDNTKASHD